jgi:hypothetical protein
LDYLTTHTNQSPIRREFAPGFQNYKKGCTRLAVASDKVYQLLVHGLWFSSGTPASSTTKTGRHDIAEILLKVALSTINQIIIYSTGLNCDRHKFDIYDIIMLRVSFCSNIWYYNILAYYLGSIFAYYLDPLDTQYNNDINVVLSR